MRLKKSARFSACHFQNSFQSQIAHTPQPYPTMNTLFFATIVDSKITNGKLFLHSQDRYVLDIIPFNIGKSPIPAEEKSTVWPQPVLRFIRP